MKNRENALRDALAIFFLTLVCAAAIYQSLEFVAIFALLGIGAIVFKFWTKTLATSLLNALLRSRAAKVGPVELALIEKKTYEEKLASGPAWMQIAISELSAEEIGLLLTVYRAGRLPATEALKPSFRQLRARGLLRHDEGSMTSATQVWLTQLGSELASQMLLETSPPPPQTTEIESIDSM